MHASDAATAYLAIADTLVDAAASPAAFNVASGKLHTTLAVATQICELAGTALSPTIEGDASDADQRLVDAGALTAATGWKPRVTLDEGLRQTLAWQRAAAAAAS